MIRCTTTIYVISLIQYDIITNTIPSVSAAFKCVACFRFCQVLLSSLSACFFVCLSYFQLLSLHRSPALLHIHTQHPISHICKARPCTYTLSVNATTPTFQRTQTWRTYSHKARTRPLISYSFEHHMQRAALATHTHLWPHWGCHMECEWSWLQRKEVKNI